MVYFAACPRRRRENCRTAVAHFDELHDAQEARDFAEAVRVADVIANLCPKCPHAAKDKADALGALGESEAAANLVDELLIRSEDQPHVLILKGSIVAGLRDLDGSLQWYEKALAIDPEDHSVNCQLAQTYFLLGKPEAALPYARRAWITKPAEDLAIGILIRLLVEMDLDDELESVLSKLHSVRWTAPSFIVSVSGGFRKLGQTETAIEWCRKALELAPDDSEALCLLSGLLTEQNDYDGCLEVFSHLHRVDPDHGKSAFLFNARQVADEQGQLRVAVDIIVEARTLYPMDHDIKDYYGHLMERTTGNVARLAEEIESWKRRFAAMEDEHSSLRRAVKELHQAAEPGLPLGIALVEGESQSVEFMRTFPESAHELAKEIAAFSTSNDGTIFMGATDDGQVMGMPDVEELTGRDTLQQRISGITSGSIKPPTAVALSFVPYQGKYVARIFVPKGVHPVYYVNNKPYLRHLDKSRQAEPDEVEDLIRRANP